ncbi:Ionotropic receptor 129 [Diabrotica virgifera virgifera]|nr:Ionotropic receptor 129 [Diabrotica virgifera virgifera]
MFLLCLLLSGIIFTEAHISVKNNTRNLENCINELIKSIILNKQIVYVINTNIRIINYPVVFYNRISQIRKMSRIIPNIYIISGNISEVLSVLHKSNMLDNSNDYIFYIQNIEKNLINSLEQYFISRALLIMLSSKQSYYEIYKMTFDSQLHHKLIDICPKHKDFQIHHNDNLKNVILKKTEYLNVLYDISAPFIVSSTKGIHIELLNIIAKNIKVKLNFVKTKEHASSVHISAEFINNRTYDLYAAILSATLLDKAYLYDVTVRITEDKVVFLTPNILITNNWTIFYGEFKMSVWIYFMLLLLSISIVIYVIDYLIPEKQQTDIISFLLSMLFEGSVTLYTSKKSLKIIFINYLIFVLIFTTMYKSQMFDILRKNNAYNPIKCRKDLLNFNFKICLPSQAVLDISTQSIDPIDHYFSLSGRSVINRTHWGCLNMTAYENNIVSVRSLKVTKYDVPNKYVDEKGYPLLNILEEDFHSYVYFNFAFRKCHPLFDIFNKKLTILKESGFIQYHYKIYEEEYEKALAAMQKKHNFYFKALKISNLQSVFFAYFALIGTSSLVFCLEILL